MNEIRNIQYKEIIGNINEMLYNDKDIVGNSFYKGFGG